MGAYSDGLNERFKMKRRRTGVASGLEHNQRVTRQQSRPLTGLWSTLSAEQKRRALAWSGEDELIGRHEFPIVVPVHPQAYPNHGSDKGIVCGGECNRTACNNAGASFFNIGTRGYYCRPCADGINWQPGRILCVAVDHDLTHQEMDELYTGRSEW